MADATLSIAAVLSVVPVSAADPATAAVANGGEATADPFAELLAAMTEPVAEPARPAATTQPVVATPLALPAAAIVDLPQPGSETSDDTKDKDGSADPLGDAITAGATAVLALAQPVALPVALPARQPVDTGIAAVTSRTTPAPTVVARAGTAQAAAPDAGFAAAQASAAATQAAPADAQPAQVRPDGAADAIPAPPAADPASVTAPPAATTPPPRVAPAPSATAAEVIRALAPPPVQTAQTAPVQAQASAPAAAPEVKAEPAATPEAAPASPARRTEAPVTVSATHRAEHTAAIAQTATSDRATLRRADDTVAIDSTLLGQAPQSAPSLPSGTPTGAAEPTTTDGIVQQQLSIAADGRWLDSLARDIAQSAGSGNSLHFRLEPPSLGALTVQIAQAADGAAIRMTADNDTTRTILVDAQPRLVAEARAQGLRISETHVDLGNSGGGSGSERWAGSTGQGGGNGAASGQGRQSSPGHQPFVRTFSATPTRTAESPDDSDALYA